MGCSLTPADLPFDEVIFSDFEFIAKPGELPDVVCLCARELRSGRIFRLWCDQLGDTPPYRTDDLERLLSKILPHIDLGVALYRGESVAAAALMEHRGVPLDMEGFSQLADKHTWRAVRDALVPTIDAQYGVYVQDKNGDWSFNMERFAAYLKRE